MRDDRRSLLPLLLVFLASACSSAQKRVARRSYLVGDVARKAGGGAR